MRKTLLAVALAVLASGCAAKRVTVDAPTERLAESQAAIRAAEQSGAARVPEAAIYLGFAHQSVVEAQRLMGQGRHDAAELQLKQASADAQLALAMARAVPLEDEARRLTNQANALRRNAR
jgi:heat shock protein HslJ